MAYNQDTKKTVPTHVGERGDHPVGGAVGAIVGGAAGAAAAVAGATQGALMGAAAGPVGIAAGAGIGAVVGALAGKGIAQAVNPTTEDAYWENEYKKRDYVEPNAGYDNYGPAYRYGVDAYSRFEGRPFDQIEPQLGSDWNTARDKSTLEWDKARHATRDAYDRLHTRGTGNV